jgi:hypothetical protein
LLKSGETMAEEYIGWLEGELKKHVEGEEEKVVSISLGWASTIILLYIFSYTVAWFVLIAP